MQWNFGKNSVNIVQIRVVLIISVKLNIFHDIVQVFARKYFEVHVIFNENHIVRCLIPTIQNHGHSETSR